MHVAVFGAGALGAVYGVRLASRTQTDVTFVVRPARVDSPAPITIESVRRKQREKIDTPARAATVPRDADVVLLAVGTEDLEAIRGPLETSDAPIVVLTPMLPHDWERIRAAYGDRVLAAMPSVVSYLREDGVFRYWLPPAPTRIDEPRPGTAFAEPVRVLAEALDEAKLRTRLELGVHERNPATSVCFIAIPMALAIAKSAEALDADESLLSLVARACREGGTLASRIGSAEPWAELVAATASPFTIRMIFTLIRRFSEEALFYAEEHFGRKLHAQHVVMARAMAELARNKRLPHAALEELAERLASV